MSNANESNEALKVLAKIEKLIDKIPYKNVNIVIETKNSETYTLQKENINKVIGFQ